MPRKIRPVRIDGNVAYVMLTRGFEAVIDAKDAPLVAGYNWYAQADATTIYARRDIRTKDLRRNIRMHQVILPAPEGLTPDHIDRNGLNNRRENLRLATAQQQVLNQSRFVEPPKGMVGVSWEKARGKFRACIKARGRGRHLGYFVNAAEAAEAYAKAWSELHGDLFAA